MSRLLPPQPNLEHLKKQAKDLLQDVQRRNPDWTLSEAQHAIAREYGFASWPKLKTHVDSLPRDARESGGTAAPQAGAPFVGRWIASLAKSRRHPANRFQQATIEFAVAGDIVTITDVFIDESGREERGTNVVQVDGREHVSERGHGYSMVASWVGSHVLETVATQNGEVVGRGKYEVSANGKTLTITDASGDQTIVCDREPADRADV